MVVQGTGPQQANYKQTAREMLGSYQVDHNILQNKKQEQNLHNNLNLILLSTFNWCNKYIDSAWSHYFTQH